MNMGFVTLFAGALTLGCASARADEAAKQTDEKPAVKEPSRVTPKPPPKQRAVEATHRAGQNELGAKDDGGRVGDFCTPRDCFRGGPKPVPKAVPTTKERQKAVDAALDGAAEKPSPKPAP